MSKALYRRIDRPSLDAVPSTSIPAICLPALAQLAERMLFARARGDDAWQSAASFAELRALGLILTDCRDLVTSGLVAVIPLSARKIAGSIREPPARTPSPIGRRQGKGGSKSGMAGHRANGRAVGGRKVAGTVPRSSARKGSRSLSFPGRGQGEGMLRTARRSTPDLPPLGPRTQLLLTDLGLTLITKHAQSSRVHPLPPGEGRGEGGREPSPSGRGQAEGVSVSPSLPPSVSPSPLLPHYDIDLRELAVSGITILQLRLQARNLTAVLKAFQIAGWPPRVVKPLNCYPDASDPQHLADAVYGLNRHQSLIEFRTDGSAIRWQWRSTQDAHRRATVLAVARKRC
jgi:hypothetical protein